MIGTPSTTNFKVNPDKKLEYLNSAQKKKNPEKKQKTEMPAGSSTGQLTLGLVHSPSRLQNSPNLSSVSLQNIGNVPQVSPQKSLESPVKTLAAIFGVMAIGVMSGNVELAMNMLLLGAALMSLASAPQKVLLGLLLASKGMPRVGGESGDGYATSPDCVVPKSFSTVTDENFNGLVSFLESVSVGAGLYCVPESEKGNGNRDVVCVSHFDSSERFDKAELQFVEGKFQKAVKNLFKFLYPESKESNCDTMALILGYNVNWLKPVPSQWKVHTDEINGLTSTVSEAKLLVDKAGVEIGQLTTDPRTFTTIDGHALAQLCWDALTSYYTMVYVQKPKDNIISYQNHQTEFEKCLVRWDATKIQAKKSDNDFVKAFLNDPKSTEYIMTQYVFTQHLYVSQFFNQTNSSVWNSTAIPATYDSITTFANRDFKPDIFKFAFDIANDLVEITKRFDYLTNSTTILTPKLREALVRSQRILNPPKGYTVEDYEADRDWLTKGENLGMNGVIEQQIANLIAYNETYESLKRIAGSLSLENEITTDYHSVQAKLLEKNVDPNILPRFINAFSEQERVELIKELTNARQVDILKNALNAVLDQNKAIITEAKNPKKYLKNENLEWRKRLRTRVMPQLRQAKKREFFFIKP